jgi:hypothetical protein
MVDTMQTPSIFNVNFASTFLKPANLELFASELKQVKSLNDAAFEKQFLINFLNSKSFIFDCLFRKKN